MATRRTSQKSASERTLDLVREYWLVILGIIIGLIYLIPFIKRKTDDQQVVNYVNDIENATKVNNEENKVKSPTLQKSKADKILAKYPKAKSKYNQLKADASALAHHFGQKYKWYDVKNWTENDGEIGKILRRNPGTFPILEELYFNVYTESKNLREAIEKNLDKDEYDKTVLTFKKYGYKWLS